MITVALWVGLLCLALVLWLLRDEIRDFFGGGGPGAFQMHPVAVAPLMLAALGLAVFIGLIAILLCVIVLRRMRAPLL